SRERNMWTDGCDKIGSSLFTQAIHGGNGCASFAPLPAGVAGRHPARASTCKEDRNAVGGTNSRGNLAVSREHDVAFSLGEFAAFFASVRYEVIDSMHLTEKIYL